MKHNKKTEKGRNKRIDLLRPHISNIEGLLDAKPQEVGTDDLLDAAAAAWTALRRYRGEAHRVCTPERDERGLEVPIFY